MKNRKSGLVLFISGTVYIIGMAFVAGIGILIHVRFRGQKSPQKTTQ